MTNINLTKVLTHIHEQVDIYSQLKIYFPPSNIDIYIRYLLLFTDHLHFSFYLLFLYSDPEQFAFEHKYLCVRFYLIEINIPIFFVKKKTIEFRQ